MAFGVLVSVSVHSSYTISFGTSALPHLSLLTKFSHCAHLVTDLKGRHLPRPMFPFFD